MESFLPSSLILLTPADAQVDTKVVLLSKHRDHEEVVQVDSLHEEPIAVSGNAVLHHHNGNPTTNRCLKHEHGATHMNVHGCYWEFGIFINLILWSDSTMRVKVAM